MCQQERFDAWYTYIYLHNTTMVHNIGSIIRILEYLILNLYVGFVCVKRLAVFLDLLL